MYFAAVHDPLAGASAIPSDTPNLQPSRRPGLSQRRCILCGKNPQYTSYARKLFNQESNIIQQVVSVVCGGTNLEASIVKNSLWLDSTAPPLCALSHICQQCLSKCKKIFRLTEDIRTRESKLKKQKDINRTASLTKIQGNAQLREKLSNPPCIISQMKSEPSAGVDAKTSVYFDESGRECLLCGIANNIKYCRKLVNQIPEMITMVLSLICDAMNVEASVVHCVTWLDKEPAPKSALSHMCQTCFFDVKRLLRIDEDIQSKVSKLCVEKETLCASIEQQVAGNDFLKEKLMIFDPSELQRQASVAVS